jgi:hypothetical protein
MPETDPPEHLPGVIRLLMEGHFKGVADVRLRINFFEELNAIQAGKLQEVAGEKVPGLVESVQQTVQTLISSGQLSEEQSASLAEQLGGFTQSVTQLLEEFNNSQDPAQEGLISGLNAAFADLDAAVASLFPADTPVTPAADEPPTASLPTPSLADPTAEAAVDDASPSAFNASTFLEDLRSVYQTALASLQEGLDQSDILPPLSEPEGQGRAYAKFLAIYQQLGGGDNPADNQERGDIVGTYV